LRIRSIKPEFFKHEELADLEPLARLLFIGLWCLADCEGRMLDRPRRIKVEVLPYDDCDVPDMLGALDQWGFISRYVVGEVRVIEIVGFKKHQRISGKEKDYCSNLPECPEDYEGSTREAPGKHPGASQMPRKGKERSKGEERKGSKSCAEPAPPDSPPDPVFLVFPTARKNVTWDLTETKAAEYQDSFPGLDVFAELRKARQWSIDHPRKRKTARGLPGHLTTWLSNACDRPARPTSQQRYPKPPTQSEVIAEMAREARAEENARPQLRLAPTNERNTK